MFHRWTFSTSFVILLLLLSSATTRPWTQHSLSFSLSPGWSGLASTWRSPFWILLEPWRWREQPDYKSNSHHQQTNIQLLNFVAATIPQIWKAARSFKWWACAPYPWPFESKINRLWLTVEDYYRADFQVTYIRGFRYIVLTYTPINPLIPIHIVTKLLQYPRCRSG